MGWRPPPVTVCLMDAASERHGSIYSVSQVVLPIHVSDRFEAGNFKMGCSIDDNDCDPDEGKRGGTTVFIDAFYIQQHEVSVAEYRTCVKTTKCATPYTYQRNKYLCISICWLQ